MELELIRSEELYKILVDALEEALDTWKEQGEIATRETVFQYLVLDLLIELIKDTPEILESVLSISLPGESEDPQAVGEDSSGEEQLFSLILLLSVAAEDCREKGIKGLAEVSPQREACLLRSACDGVRDISDGPDDKSGQLQGKVREGLGDDSPLSQTSSRMASDVQFIIGGMEAAVPGIKEFVEIPPEIRFQMLTLQCFVGFVVEFNYGSLFVDDDEEADSMDLLIVSNAISLVRDKIISMIR